MSVAVVTVLSFAAPAMAAHDTGTSMSFEGKPFPHADGKYYVFSTRAPKVDFRANATVDGFIYTLSRSPFTIPTIPSDPLEPTTAYLPLGWTGGTTGLPIASGLLAIDAWMPLQTSLPMPMAGVVDPIEGWWYVAARAIIASETPAFSSETTVGFFLIDVTPPAAVSGLKPTTGSIGVWTRGSRRDVQWDNPIGAGTTLYDSLSGENLYRVTLNGTEVVVARVVESMPFNYCSFEDLGAGANYVGVSAIDFAGNVGPETRIQLLVDPDVPSITNTTPDYLGRYAGLSCIAADAAGVKSVSYTVNGVPAGTSYSAPFGITVDMARFGIGTHTVIATATDMAGQTASSTKTTRVLNLTVPTVTRMSDSPDPFFPIKRDRYRDTTRISYRLGERAYVKLEILDSSGSVVREMAGWRGGGANSFVWNGRRTDGSIVVGTYRYRIIANDGAYNVFTTGLGTTKIRSYYLKRISRSRVKIVFS